MKRPVFWILLAVVAVSAAVVGVRYFPQAFSIVALDITMDRDRALTDARAIMARQGFGPAGYRQAASFALDDEAQTFVELEGGGKAAFTEMMRTGLYSAYTWRVRQFKEGEPRETTIRFRPDGQPYGFREQLKEDAPGAALDAAAARHIAESTATSEWHVDLSPFSAVEQGQERRPGGRIDHTFTYERPTPVLGEGRYRLRLVVSGDRLTEITYFIKIPEAFSRRYANMRSANEAIGIGSVVGMALLYVFGGIGVGLFFMLRQRWVIWRPAIVWGVVVAGLQALATINELPLAWMQYDTAVPRSTFLAEQAATVLAMFLGFAVFFSLSFMAAETLSRRAFGTHPQLWRAWGRGPGSSTAILGRTVAGFLLVSVFFAYDVTLYLVTTRYFGWWSPSEALLTPDVLATYAPWLSAIANSFQAGFWEESLFRAVPIAGAALIGDRLGSRRLFVVIAFVVQALVFGAGHAPYPNQPSFARPVELIVPSIGFGLLYLYFGLLPGIVLHFTFDVVWFALPVFLANAPGIWFQKLMIVVMTLVPLWIVLWRRRQAGRWTELSPQDRNEAWTPPPAAARVQEPVVAARHVFGGQARTAWRVAGLAALVVCIALLVVQARGRSARLSAGRIQAADDARAAIAARGTTLGPKWRVMPVPEDGSSGPQEFVSETAGEARRQQLVGRYLPPAGWNVRVAAFEGDVADRAEQWRASLTGTGEVRNVVHSLPEGRAGATLDEAAARALALSTLQERYHYPSIQTQLREVSAKPQKLKARTDWTFTFRDNTVPALPQGEARVECLIAGDEAVATRQFVFVPEEWERQHRAADMRNTILRVVSGLVFGGLLAGAAVVGVILWSRRQFTPRLFLMAAAVMFVVTAIRAVNNWPVAQANLLTEAPLQLQVIGVAAIGLVGLLLNAALVGLALGAVPRQIEGSTRLSGSDAWALGIAGGLSGAALAGAAAWLRTPAWAQTPDVIAFGSVVPILQVALDPIPGTLIRIAVIAATLAALNRFTAEWTRRVAIAVLALVAVGFFAGGAPAGIHLGGWLAAAAITGIGLAVVSMTLLRVDISIVPLGVASMAAVTTLIRGAGRAFPGQAAGSVLGAVFVMAIGWWCCKALRGRSGAGL